jgi:putative tryptophan/tyrosine transport system substrate-binding protein
VTRQGLDDASKTMKVDLKMVDVSAFSRLEKAFDQLKNARIGAVLIASQNWAHTRPREVAEIALRRRMPTMFGEPVAVRSGGLMSYSTDWVDLSRKAAIYVDRILKGAKPGDLPVEFPTTFHLVINKKTAKALGLTLAPSLVLRADEVIE